MEVRVLMVDDHPPIIEGYKAMLSNHTKPFKFNVLPAYSSESAYDSIVNSPDEYDIITLDITMPAYVEKKINSGMDLIPFIRKHKPKSKIIIITSHFESLVLFKVQKECYPEGIMVKSDFIKTELATAFESVLDGETHYSKTVLDLKTEMAITATHLDIYCRQMIILLNQGIQTKNLPEHLNLSKSAVDKRKVIIKEYFNIEKGNDEDILREARKRGMI